MTIRRESQWLIDGYIGQCPSPGCGKRSFRDRKAAKRYARRQYPSDRMQAYECRKGGIGFHVGHAAPEVVSGEIPKQQFYGKTGVGRVRQMQGTRITPGKRGAAA